ncbi:acyl-CoA carboxylase epsilon subunit [Streptomyces sp. NPDC050704]|uniref:acyl-CoA carboxylase epsilon subunit n=1 Tax=Streptomyces sp. NPDC050704 TaxID=3157219 RepID=UPI00342EDE43
MDAGKVEAGKVTSVIRVENGSVGPDELAALTAVLLARAAGSAAGGNGAARRARPAARWSRPERAVMFVSPRSWQR